jgi:hypothetical protein
MYSTAEDESEYQQTFISLPLMLRLNSNNLNHVYFDYGIVPTFLLHGKLKESAGNVSDAGTVTQWVPRTDLLFRMSMTWAYNRFLIGARLDAKLFKKSEAQFNELKDNWALGSDSPLLRTSPPGNPFRLVYGVFIGLRIK